MATTVTSIRDENSILATYVDDTGGGTSKNALLKGFPIQSVQRISGAGTYTVQGSLDGVMWEALPTPLAAINDDIIHIITGAPRFVRVQIAAAAATVIVYGVG